MRHSEGFADLSEGRPGFPHGAHRVVSLFELGSLAARRTLAAPLDAHELQVLKYDIGADPEARSDLF